MQAPTSKKFEKTFWYYTNMMKVEWGYSHSSQYGEERGFATEELAQKAYLDWLAARPELKADSPVNMSVGSDIFVDFDGTIYKGPLGTHDSEMEAPDWIVVKTLQQLHAGGMKIILYSCRSNPAVVGSNGKANQLTTYMQRYCGKHKIPYDRIEEFKPHYHLLIDDRAVSGKDWTSVRQSLGMDALKEDDTGPEVLPYDFIGLR